MKLKNGFILRKCGEVDIVVPVGASVEQYKNLMVTVSGSGRLLWDMLEKGCERADLVSALMKKYDVERDIVEKDVDIFLKKLTQAGILDD
ncbi:MAG: PqqD family protein [Clostridia bacterium]|nr:PqqD family protein [Clostridia bacterium]